MLVHRFKFRALPGLVPFGFFTADHRQVTAAAGVRQAYKAVRNYAERRTDQVPFFAHEFFRNVTFDCHITNPFCSSKYIFQLFKSQLYGF